MSEKHKRMDRSGMVNKKMGRPRSEKKKTGPKKRYGLNFTEMIVSLKIGDWCQLPLMNSMKTFNSVTFYFMKKLFSDISRKYILPN